MAAVCAADAPLACRFSALLAAHDAALASAARTRGGRWEALKSRTPVHKTEAQPRADAPRDSSLVMAGIRAFGRATGC